MWKYEERTKGSFFLKARRTLQTAVINLDDDDPEAVTNRAYYAAFYAATAALLEVGETPRTHGGTLNRFYFHYVTTERIPKHIGITLGYAFKARQRADYEAFAIFDGMATADLIKDVTTFVDVVESLLIEADNNR